MHNKSKSEVSLLNFDTPTMPILPKKAQNHLVICAKDVVRITGRSERSARDLLQRVRQFYKKSSKQFVSYREFCAYTGLKEDEVIPYL